MRSPFAGGRNRKLIALVRHGWRPSRSYLVAAGERILDGDVNVGERPPKLLNEYLELFRPMELRLLALLRPHRRHRLPSTRIRLKPAVVPYLLETTAHNRNVLFRHTALRRGASLTDLGFESSVKTAGRCATGTYQAGWQRKSRPLLWAHKPRRETKLKANKAKRSLTPNNTKIAVPICV